MVILHPLSPCACHFDPIVLPSYLRFSVGIKDNFGLLVKTEISVIIINRNEFINRDAVIFFFVGS